MAVSSTSQSRNGQLRPHKTSLPRRDYQVSHDLPSRWHSKGTSVTGIHRDQNFETLEHVKSEPNPQIESTQSSPVQYSSDSRVWHCCAHCHRKYRRAQELRRHIRDNHQPPEKCPFCHFKWTRPRNIRAHLEKDHKDRFSQEERQEIRQLRGRNDTTSFIENHGIPSLKLPRNDVLSAQANGPREQFLPSESTPRNHSSQQR
jgi:hypothetical protein